MKQTVVIFLSDMFRILRIHHQGVTPNMAEVVDVENMQRQGLAVICRHILVMESRGRSV
jgi:hypothetical protein